MKKKILILVNHEIVIYNFRKELVEKLIEDGHEIILSSPDGDKIRKLEEMGCKYVNTDISRHSKNPFTDLKLFFHYFKTIKKYRPHVVLTYTIKPNIYGGLSAKMTNTPYIANITGLGSALENKGLMQKITSFLYKVSFSKINTIFFQNEENKFFFEKIMNKSDKGKLLPGSGVNLNHFLPLPYPSEEKGINFVFISRIMKEKGIDQFLQAAKDIKSKFPHTCFHVCGFCEEEYSEILSEYERRGIITYHGMLNDIREILSTSHCTIHPSYYPEGISNSLLESAACARPIITTNRSGCREVVDNGKNGYIVQIKDTKDLILKIESFLNLSNQERNRMGNYSRRKVERDFDRNIVVEEYINVINQI